MSTTTGILPLPARNYNIQMIGAAAIQVIAPISILKGVSMNSEYRYHGQFCDFDFYVMSLDTSQHYTTHEPTTDHITLDEAVAEYKHRAPLSPDKILIVLGVNFRITAPEYMESAVNIGSFDLLQRVNSEHRVPNDFMTDKALNAEKLISVNAISIIRKLADELSEKPFNHGLTETESKLLHEHLVTADETTLHEKSAEVAAEIVHHNEKENNGDVPDDELSL